jgi:hypothetical protein
MAEELNEIDAHIAQIDEMMSEAGLPLLNWSMPVFTGSFDERGYLIPDNPGFGTIPLHVVANKVRRTPGGVVLHQLRYDARNDRYAAIELLWEGMEVLSDAAIPVGKPEGSAPLRWTEEGEDSPEGCMVGWDHAGDPPVYCRMLTPATVFTEWVTREEIQERFPHLLR